MAQKDILAAVLREHGGITDESALGHGITSLRRRIYDLRQAGWRITTCSEPGHTGRGHYVLINEPGGEPAQIGLGL